MAFEDIDQEVEQVKSELKSMKDPVPPTEDDKLRLEMEKRLEAAAKAESFHMEHLRQAQAVAGACRSALRSLEQQAEQGNSAATIG